MPLKYVVRNEEKACRMSEIGKLIKSNGLTWAQIEAYLVSKNTNPATISNLQCVFEEEMGISQPAPTNQSIGSDGTSIYSEEYNDTFLDSPDNIFQESDAMDNRPKTSQKDRDMLLDVIYDIKGGVVDVTPDNTPDKRLKDSPSDAYNRIVQDKTNQEYMGTTESVADTANTEETEPSEYIYQEESSSSYIETNEEPEYTDDTDTVPTTDFNYSNPSISSYNNYNPFGNAYTGFNFSSSNIGMYNNPWSIDSSGSGIMHSFNIPSISVGLNNVANTHKIKLPEIKINNNNSTPAINNGGATVSINDTIQPVEKPQNPENKTDVEDPQNPENKTNVEEPGKEGETTYPKLLQDRIDELTRTGNTFEVAGDSKTGYTILVTAGEYLDTNKIKSVKFYLNKEGALTNQIIKYSNGSVKFVDYTNGRKAIDLNGDYGDVDDLKKFMDVAYDNPSDKAIVDFNEDERLYTVTQTGFKDSDITKIVTTMSTEPWQNKEDEKDSATDIKKEDFIVKQVITYKDGTEETITYEKGEVVSRTKSADNVDRSQLKLKTAVKISFDLPEDANQHCKDFASALCDNKQALMSELGIDNDTYNELAQTAMAIAEKETQMMKKDVTSRLFWKSLAKDAIAAAKGSKADCSLGITQIKLGQWYNDPPKNEEQKRLKEFFENHGITKPEDLEDDKKAAIATMIALSSLNGELRAKKYKDGVEKAEQLTVTREGWELDENGIARNTGNTKSWKNEITKQDQLLLLWNMGSGRKILAEGKFTPQTEEFMYMNVGRKANLKYKLVEDKEERKAAEEIAIKEKLKDEEQKRNVEFMDNSGPIGAIRFMPGMYSNKSKHTNTEKEINSLQTKLNEKKIDKALTDKLVKALKNKELSFDFGLRDSEIEALTESDIKLILKHLDELKTVINDITTSDGINSTEAKNLRNKYYEKIAAKEKEFKKEYMNNHSKVYDISDDNPQVLRAISTEKQEIKNHDYKGRYAFTHEKSKGVNTKTTTGTIRKTDEVLAKSADKVANSNKKGKSGYCLNGVKTAMEDAGIDVSEMTKYGNTPKFAKNWFDMMVTKGLMVQIKYVEVSKGKGRAINESDVGTLPAGCIVLFIPDLEGGYADQAGHALVTNGYGQGNADMTDNLDWANFTRDNNTSGKGEHGTFYVYKLSDKWTVDENGKLKVMS